MAGIASLGVGSGLDLQSLVQRLVSAERAPAEGRLSRSASSLNAQISAYGQLKSGLAKLDGALKKLSDLGEARSVQVSDTKLVTATATETADLGSYSIKVTSLAAAQSLASDGFADADASLGAGQLSMSVGGTDPVTITLAEGADSLRDVRDAINEAEAGVSATLIKDGEEYRLLLTADETGLANTITVTPGTGMDARLGSAAMTQVTPPADAYFSVSGLALTSASNTIEEVLPGVTLTLKGETEENSTVTVTVGRDDQSTRKAVDAFVSAYNAVIDLTAKLSGYNAETQQGSTLTGDATLRSIRGALPAALGRETGAAWNAVEMGLRSDVQGKLSLDAEDFAARLAEDPAGALASLRGFADGLGEEVRRYSDAEGLLDNRTEGMKASLKAIETQYETLARRMESYEARLVKQFSALDQMVAQMNSTSSYLTAQLANIGKQG
ncbi:flagellar filament capping protein FliD [Thioalkalivibrio sp. XN279]|uniref:flagellar filament capping protein FliD n=1 Tax=Thioalkalivibrio sp. XN279 TaxID=2714953 RepID=UPI00140932C7|nr:flagellar filament capping protein FliD [Thioalkalivibrio sp. XN279]NHA13375.1 flagellar filament capping protein FliD [Thioalkalivibrio sp. XN279]